MWWRVAIEAITPIYECKLHSESDMVWECSNLWNHTFVTKCVCNHILLLLIARIQSRCSEDFAVKHLRCCPVCASFFQWPYLTVMLSCLYFRHAHMHTFPQKTKCHPPPPVVLCVAHANQFSYSSRGPPGELMVCATPYSFIGGVKRDAAPKALICCQTYFMLCMWMSSHFLPHILLYVPH